MNLFHISVEWLVVLISQFATKEIAFAFAFGILAVSLLIWGLCVLRPHRTLMRALNSATRAVRQATANPKWKPRDQLAAVDKALANNPAIQEIWKPYRHALRDDPKREGHYVNPVDPYKWFCLERLPGRGYEKWASTWAGISLTVGLLFTFVGLTAALLKVGEAGADTAQLRLAIAEILRISSAKFITSMAGILAYIGWTLVARSYASAQSKATAALATAIQALSAPLTPEAVLLDQLDESREQTKRLKTLSDDMAVAFDASLNKVVGQRLDALPSAVGQFLQPAFEQSVRPVVQAIEAMGGAIGAGNHAAIHDMVSGLMSSIKDATGTEMGLLTSSMRDAAGELKAAKTGIGDGGTEFGQSLARAAEGMTLASARMAEAMEQRVGEIDARMSRIDAVLSSGADRLDSMGGSMTERMAEGLRQAMETIAAVATAGAATARDQAQAELAPVLGELKNLMEQIRLSAEESRGALVAGGRSAATDLGAALSKASSELSEASKRMSEVMGHRAGEIDDRMHRIDAVLSTGAERLSAMGGSMSEQMRDGLRHAMESITAAASAGAETARSQAQAELAPLLGELKNLMTGIRQSAEESRGALVEGGRTAANDLSTALSKASGDLSGASTRMVDAMEHRVGEVDARMSRIDAALLSGAERFTAMGGSMSEQMADGLRNAMESIAGAAAAGAETARGQAQAELAPLLGELKNLMGDIRQSAEESRGALVAGGRSAADDLGSALSKASGELSSASMEASAAMIRSFEEASSRILTTVEGSVAGYRTATESLADRLAVVEQGFSALEQAVGRNVVHLDEAGGALTAAGRTFGVASDQLRAVATPIAATLQSVESAATQTREALQVFERSGGALREAALAMTSSSQSAARAFESYEHRFASVDESLGKTVLTLRDGVVELGNRVTEVVEDYDKHLGDAIGLLRSGVGDIADAVESLSERTRENA